MYITLRCQRPSNGGEAPPLACVSTPKARNCFGSAGQVEKKCKTFPWILTFLKGTGHTWKLLKIIVSIKQRAVYSMEHCEKRLPLK